MPQTSALEQWLLEFINLARMDPSGMAARFRISLNDGLAPGTISSAPKAVLAMSEILQLSADFHGQYQLDQGSFSTIGIEGSHPGDRMAFAGFSDGEGFDWAETINWRTFASGAQVSEDTVLYNIWRDLFLAPGARAIILSDDFNEAGLSLLSGPLGGSSTQKSYVVTNDFGGSDEVFITGGIYDPNEFLSELYVAPTGIGGVSARVGTTATTSNAAGGYRVEVDSGTQQFKIGNVSLTVLVGTENIKIDLMGTSQIRADHSIMVKSGAVQAELLGIGDANIVATATSGVLYLDGNSGNNRLVGGNANNLIDGHAGADTMEGGKGDDRYMVDNAGDIVKEWTDAGNDTIVTTVSYTLRSGSHVETIETLYDIFTDPINLKGNSFSQTLYGNLGSNILDGGGGGDTLYGSGGDDLYYVRNAADQIGEFSDEGTDTVRSYVSFALSSDDSIEYLTTTSTTGTSAINLTGNDFAQTIRGNAGSNILDGLGGADSLAGYAGNDILRGGAGDDKFYGGTGADLLTGGTGTDSFYFTIAPLLADADTITDFVAAQDRIYLERDYYGVTGSRLGSTQFKDLSLGSIDANDRIIFDRTLGNLYFDADGSGAQDAQLFAHLSNGAVVTHADFWLV